MLIAFDDIRDAARTVSDVIASGLVPAALEMMDRRMIESVENFAHAGYPTGADAILLVDIVGHPAGTGVDAGSVEHIARRRGAIDIRVAVDDDERALLWRGRKNAFGSIAQSAPDYYLNDTVVPRTRFVDVLDEVYRIADREGLRLMNVFHAGDGNFHPLVTFDASEQGMTERVVDASHEMIRAAVAAGGTLSGEHGIGLEKRDLMHLVFSPQDLDAQARIRDAFDQEGRLNPGKVLPAGARLVAETNR